jgi:acyl-CoA synthetase (AMP-forming)/AMP-acid ligase II
MADNTIHALAPQRIGRTDSWLVAGPLYHGAALAYSVTAIHFAQTVHLLREFDAAKACRAVSQGFGTVTWFIPTMSRRIVDHVGQSKASVDTLKNLRLIISAGAPLDISLRRELLSTFTAAQIIDILGQTELTSTILVLAEPRDIAAKPTAIGLPMPGMSIAILDDKNNLVPTGEVGELCYRSECLMLGYWNKPELTAEAMAGGWFHSGDLARRDVDGVVFLVGRKKEIIKTGGENVVPNEVESILREVPHVMDACVIGLKDRVWGERIHAVVAIGDAALDKEGLRAKCEAHCRKRLAGYKVPKTWTLIDRLPANAIGKVDKARVREIASSQA